MAQFIFGHQAFHVLESCVIFFLMVNLIAMQDVCQVNIFEDSYKVSEFIRSITLINRPSVAGAVLQTPL